MLKESELKAQHNYKNDELVANVKTLDVIEEQKTNAIVSLDVIPSDVRSPTEPEDYVSQRESVGRRSTTMNAKSDQNGFESVVNGYQMRKNSIRVTLDSPNRELGNAIECHSVSFGYNKRNQVLSNVSLNVPKGKCHVFSV